MNSRSLNILITGAGSGLGRGLAQCLSSAERRLLLADLNLEGARETALSLKGPSEAFPLDVTSAAQIDRWFAQIGDAGVDVLINNAGLQHVARLEDFPESRWDTILDVTLKGSFLLTRAALPGMRRRGFGRIVNIGSIHALVASPFKSAYVTAKHGLLGLAKAVALETADVDITINTICPAYIRTPLVDAQICNQAATQHISEAEVIDKIMLEPMPKKAFITVEEVAAAVEFFIAATARNITGQTMVIDGGWTAR